MSDTPLEITDTSAMDPEQFAQAVDSIFATQDRWSAPIPADPATAPDGLGGDPIEGDPQGQPLEPADQSTDTGTDPAADPEDLVIGGRVIPAAQVEQFLNVYDWVDTMPADLAQGIQQLSTGEYVLAPKQNPYIAGVEPQAVPPTPEAPPAPSTPQIDRSSFDPDVLALFDQQQARIDAMESQLTEVGQSASQTRAQYEAEQRERAAALAIDNFKATYNLNDDDQNDRLLIASIVRAASPVAESVTGYSNDYDRYHESIERVAWSTPQLRDGIVAAQARAMSDTAATTSAEIQAKAARAAAATAPSGSVPRSEPAPQNMTHEQRQAAQLADMADKFFRTPN